MFELTAENAAGYLARQGWLTGEYCEVTELSGGVSNVVLRVKTYTGWYVLKQSRPQLRTADPWFSDIGRVFREIDVMQMLAARIEPGIVPQILFRDDANYSFLMTHAPRDARDWRSQLLEGTIDPNLGETAGRILGQIHQATPAGDPELDAFRDKSVFEQLRIEPFYRRVVERCPDAAPRLKLLINAAANKVICLCHGDFSPKNLLLAGKSFTLVDYETAHLGDPAFDLGFFLSHLFLKALVHPARCGEFYRMCTAFWEAYRSTFRYRPFDALAAAGQLHLGGCLLARVVGAGPAPYLTDPSKKDAARRIALHILLDGGRLFDETFAMLASECKRLEETNQG